MEQVSEELQGYRKLKAWQNADGLVAEVWRALKDARGVPPWLAQQMMRAAVSVPANLAEGYSRGSLGDYLRFLDIARGSLGELEYYIHLVGKLRLLDDGVSSHLTSAAAETGRLLFGLIRALSKKAREESWDRSRCVREEAGHYLAEANGEGIPTVVDQSPPVYDSGFSINDPERRRHNEIVALVKNAEDVVCGRDRLDGLAEG